MPRQGCVLPLVLSGCGFSAKTERGLIDTAHPSVLKRCPPDGRRKHLVAVPFGMFDVLDAATRAKQEFAQSCPAFGKWSLSHVITIEHQKVESAGNREVIVGAAVQGIKISHPVLARANRLGIKESRAPKPVGFVNDEWIALRPCQDSSAKPNGAPPAVADKRRTL